MNSFLRLPALRAGLALMLCALLPIPQSLAEEDDPVEEAEVVWSHERCEYILITKADGHGIVSQFSAERMKAGDRISAPFHLSVQSFKKFTHRSTGETGMLRGTAFGLTRAQALKKIHGICRRYAPKE